MNQVAFSSLHLGAMGCAGYLLGQAVQMNPKLGVMIGIVSSIFFQMMSEISYRIHLKDLEGELKDKTPAEQERYGRNARHVTNWMCVQILAFGGILSLNETSFIRELAKLTLLTLGLTLTSYLSARVGSYYFLSDKDFSILGADRKRVW